MLNTTISIVFEAKVYDELQHCWQSYLVHVVTVVRSHFIVQAKFILFIKLSQAEANPDQMDLDQLSTSHLTLNLPASIFHVLCLEEENCLCATNPPLKEWNCRPIKCAYIKVLMQLTQIGSMNRTPCVGSGITICSCTRRRAEQEFISKKRIQVQTLRGSFQMRNRCHPVYLWLARISKL